jgi:hypothetical protein
MLKYEIMPYNEVKKYETYAISEKVSEIARSPNGWYHTLKKNKGDISNMPVALIKKRDSFISRTLPVYLKNPTFRRLISLYMWSFDPYH